MKKISLLIVSLVAATAVAQVDSLKTEPFKDAVHLREIPRKNLVIDLGVTQPLSDYGSVARSGLHIGAEYLYYTNKHLGLGISLRHQYNEFGYIDFQTDDRTVATANNWTNTSIAIGPTYSYTQGRFQFDVFVKAGVAFLNSPENSVSQIGIGNTQVFSSDSENSSSSSAYLEGGLRFNYYFRRSVQLFFSPQYNTTLGEPIAYSFRDDSSTAPIQPNLLKKLNASNLIFNLGVKIAIGKEYSSGEWRDDD
ncbi:autotransporter outer membrane beta-barrel domain-containing protein [uncultured Nonlabens sp.]|uniref:autotransporter outer membrane beta-barrel domain-containing protein n=1 Tax=uncultured Nonlabens sp. TaxID=859306 RepID=UPI0026387CA2|nr:autotransporter outer membrane beta-barrel domain-containing protein [uncultured Nonlabens sp.]